MANITKVYVHGLGEFSIKFSSRNFLFEIDYPKDIAQNIKTKVERNFNLKCWDDVKAELDNIRDQFLAGEKYIRDVIVIVLETSESDYMITKSVWGANLRNEIKEVKTDSKINDGTGFVIKWYVAKEYQIRNSLRYKIIEANNEWGVKGFEKMNILPQLIRSQDPPIVVTYREDLHEFLKSLEGEIKKMLDKMVAFFSPNNAETFLKNFEQGNMKLLGE